MSKTSLWMAVFLAATPVFAQTQGNTGQVQQAQLS